MKKTIFLGGVFIIGILAGYYYQKSKKPCGCSDTGKTAPEGNAPV